MKLSLNEKQRGYLLEIFKVSEKNAVNAEDFELASSFKSLSKKITPTNVVYYNLKRPEAESILEYCEIISSSLTNAYNYVENDASKSEEYKKELKEEIEDAKREIDEVSDFLKVKMNLA